VLYTNVHSHVYSVTALVSSDGETGTAVYHLHCSRLLDGCKEQCERLRQARRAVVGGRRAVGDLNRELFLDGHSSHIYSLDFTELMTANNV